MVRDQLETQDAQKVMAQAMILFAAAPAIAPLVGGWLHDAFGWRSVFWFLAFYAFALSLFTLWNIPESLQYKKRNSIHILKVLKVYSATLRNQHYLRLVFILAFAFSSFFLYVAGAPTLLFNILKFQPDQFYILFIPVVSGIMIGAFISARLIKRLNNAQMINLFLSLMLIIALLNFLLTQLLHASIYSLLIPLIFYSTCLAAIMPIFSILIIDCFPDNRGSAAAMQSFIQMGFNGLSVSFIVALLGPHPENFAGAQVILVGLAFVLWRLDRLW